MPVHHPSHPGEILREDVLPALELTVTALAAHLGYSRGQLSAILNGHAPIRADLAVRLEQAGLSTARQWLAMQAARDIWEAEHRDHPQIARLQVA
ncbi:MAG TPA: HigA family addiction module antitoxin [Pseudomonas sp.]|uniref:HigA family addiction module antitoxin n=1 Tax=Pseudomonas sp. TaxID=306 RepID=UPI002C4C9F6F|nr:HigA family addiction module antitoxin [Pseudomonas sp.]HWH86347.1 HigA family addiction module antitoxin [Pseudomonas sp.]